MMNEKNNQTLAPTDYIGEQSLTASELYRSILLDYPDVLDVNQVSVILGVSTKIVYRLLNDGVLPSLKVGRAFKVPKLYLLQYLNILDQH